MGDKDKNTHEKLRPCLGNSLTDDAERTEDTTPEQGSSATKVVIQGVREPCSNQAGADVRSNVDSDELAA